jgi:hypothetical protein
LAFYIKNINFQFAIPLGMDTKSTLTTSSNYPVIEATPAISPSNVPVTSNIIHMSTHHIGCQASSLPSSILMKDPKKFTLPFYMIHLKRHGIHLAGSFMLC